MNKALLLLAILTLSAPGWPLTGKIVDGKNKPVAGAKVIVSAHWSVDQTFHTDDIGEFVLLKRLNSDGTVNVYTSKVTDSDGKPVPKATVIVPGQRSFPSSVLVTNAAGSFTYRVPEESKHVYRVTDSAGAPIPRAKVLFTSINPKRKSEIVMDDKGDYTPKGAQEPPTRERKQVFIQVVAKGYTYATEYFPAEQKQVSIKLRPEQPLKARVVGEDGKPLPGAKVTLLYASAGEDSGQAFSFSPESTGSRVSIVTAKDGSFTLRHLPGGLGAISAQVRLMLDGPGRAQIERTDSIDHLRKSGKIVLPRECIVQGTLCPPGKTGALPERTELFMDLLEDGGSDYPTRHFSNVDKNGKFRFDKLPPGKATITLWTLPAARRVAGETSLNWVLPSVQDLRVSPADVNNLELVGVTGSVVSGIVLDKTTGKPVTSAMLSIQHSGNPKGDRWYTDRDGKYAFRVCAGSVKVLVDGMVVDNQPLDYRDKDKPSVSVEVTDGQDKPDVDLSISPPVEREAAQDESEPQEPEERKIPADFELKPGVYDLAWDADFDAAEHGTVDSETVDARKLVKKAPAFVSTKPVYIAYRIDGAANGDLLIAALDESLGQGKGYDTVYVDVGRDFDLSNDQPLKFAKEGEDGEWSVTPWFTLRSHQGPPDGEHTSNPVQCRLRGWTPPRRKKLAGIPADAIGMLGLQKKGAWTGYVDSSKGKVQFALVDYNANGIYGDRTNFENWDKYGRENLSFGDFAAADATGVGKAPSDGRSPGTLILCEVSKLGDKLYDISSNPVGDKLSIATYDGPTGQLTGVCGKVQGFSGTVGQIMLAGKVGLFIFEDWDGKPITVPAGAYNAAGLEAELDTKDKFAFECSFDQGPTIEPNKLQTLTVGGALSVAISPGSPVLTLKAGSSENVKWLVKIGENAVIDSPGGKTTARFYDAKAKLAATTRIDTWACREIIVRVPDLKPGAYTMHISQDTRSSLGVLSAKKPVKIVSGAVHSGHSKTMP